MSFTRSKDKRHAKCIVERPDGASYLYFQKFSLQIGNDYELMEGMAQSVRFVYFCSHFNRFPEYLRMCLHLTSFIYGQVIKT